MLVSNRYRFFGAAEAGGGGADTGGSGTAVVSVTGAAMAGVSRAAAAAAGSAGQFAVVPPGNGLVIVQAPRPSEPATKMSHAAL